MPTLEEGSMSISSRNCGGISQGQWTAASVTATHFELAIMERTVFIYPYGWRVNERRVGGIRMPSGSLIFKSRLPCAGCMGSDAIGMRRRKLVRSGQGQSRRDKVGQGGKIFLRLGSDSRWRTNRGRARKCSTPAKGQNPSSFALIRSEKIQPLQGFTNLYQARDFLALRDCSTR